MFGGSNSNKKQNIVFGKNVKIKGKIIFENEVDLKVDDSATIPTIDYTYKK